MWKETFVILSEGDPLAGRRSRRISDQPTVDFKNELFRSVTIHRELIPRLRCAPLGMTGLK
jgi:hypothetical protein